MLVDIAKKSSDAEISGETHYLPFPHILKLIVALLSILGHKEHKFSEI